MFSQQQNEVCLIKSFMVSVDEFTTRKHLWERFGTVKALKGCEYDHELPQPRTADQLMACVDIFDLPFVQNKGLNIN